MQVATSTETKSEERYDANTQIGPTQPQPRFHDGFSRTGTDIPHSAPLLGEHKISKTRRAQPVETNTEHAAAPASQPRSIIISSKDFTDHFTPPDYLIDGVAQRRFLYSMTGNTGAGKTAVALRIAAHVALGEQLGEYEVDKGAVLYFAGENPDDLRMRWMALSEQMPFDRSTIDVHFVVGAEVEISKIKERIEAEVQALGGISLVIVDTSAAYFNCEDCDDENNNVQARKHAAMFRSLTKLPGGPTVLVLAHPTKNVKSDNLLPVSATPCVTYCRRTGNAGRSRAQKLKVPT